MRLLLTSAVAADQTCAASRSPRPQLILPTCEGFPLRSFHPIHPLPGMLSSEAGLMTTVLRLRWESVVMGRCSLAWMRAAATLEGAWRCIDRSGLTELTLMYIG